MLYRALCWRFPASTAGRYLANLRRRRAPERAVHVSAARMRERGSPNRLRWQRYRAMHLAAVEIGRSPVSRRRCAPERAVPASAVGRLERGSTSVRQCSRHWFRRDSCPLSFCAATMPATIHRVGRYNSLAVRCGSVSALRLALQRPERSVSALWCCSSQTVPFTVSRLVPKSHATLFSQSQSLPSITSAIFGLTKSVARVTLLLTTTGTEIEPSTEMVVLFAACNS